MIAYELGEPYQPHNILRADVLFDYCSLCHLTQSVFTFFLTIHLHNENKAAVSL